MKGSCIPLSIFLSPEETDSSFIFLLFQCCIINNSHTVSYRTKYRQGLSFSRSPLRSRSFLSCSSSFTHTRLASWSLSLPTLHRQSAALKSSFDDDTMEEESTCTLSHSFFPSRCRRHSYRLGDGMNGKRGEIKMTRNINSTTEKETTGRENEMRKTGGKGEKREKRGKGKSSNRRELEGLLSLFVRAAVLFPLLHNFARFSPSLPSL